MPDCAIFPMVEADRDSAEKARRREYSGAFRKFSEKLAPAVRAKINGSATPDWQTSRTFALPVNADSAAYRSEDPDPVIEALEELAQVSGSMPKIALWIHDKIGALHSVLAVDQFRIAIGRICDAKNPRLEALLVSLAIGMNLHGNANGYAIASHFNLKPQTIHEMLGDTCTALGVPKPLAKANKARYSRTQYSHNLRRIPCSAV